MTTFELLSVEVTILLGAISVAGMAIKGWVKASALAELRSDVDEHVKELKIEINQLWDKVSKIEILSTKMDAIEKSVTRIEEAINRIGK